MIPVGHGRPAAPVKLSVKFAGRGPPPVVKPWPAWPIQRRPPQWWAPPPLPLPLPSWQRNIYIHPCRQAPQPSRPPPAAAAACHPLLGAMLLLLKVLLLVLLPVATAPLLLLLPVAAATAVLLLLEVLLLLLPIGLWVLLLLQTVLVVCTRQASKQVQTTS